MAKKIIGYIKLQLPAGAEFWSCYVNNQPAKAERAGGWLLALRPPRFWYHVSIQGDPYLE